MIFPSRSETSNRIFEPPISIATIFLRSLLKDICCAFGPGRPAADFVFASFIEISFSLFKISRASLTVGLESPEISPINCRVIGPLVRTVSKTRATFRRRKPAGEPEEDLVKAAGRNSEKVLDRIGRLLVLLPLSKPRKWTAAEGQSKSNFQAGQSI